MNALRLGWLAALCVLVAVVLGGCSNSSGETCTDDERNQNETDVDCGGVCQPCANSKACLVNSDCASGYCLEGVCTAGGASCSDGAQNQDETDVDCGGTTCDPCADGRSCQADSDCQSGAVCTAGVCTRTCVPDCTGRCGGSGDGCGGTCETCPTGEYCGTQLCRPCDTAEHCGDACVDCTAQPSDRACVQGACGCLYASDCDLDESCRNNVCESSGDCVADADCPVSQWCQGGTCSACVEDEHCGYSCRDCTGQANNRACVDGQCGCVDQADCEAGEQCQAGMCSGCQPDCAGKCGGADDGCGGGCDAGCPVGQVCNAGICEAMACQGDQDCPVGHICDGGICRPIACAGDDDCSSGEVCLGGLCTQPECTQDAECADGQWCLNYACEVCDGDLHCGSTCADCTDTDIEGDHCHVGASGAVCACANDSSCAAGRYCLDPGPAGSCTACDDDDHCGPGCTNCAGQSNNQACVDGACGCVTDGDCAAGDICQQDACTGCVPDCNGKCGNAPDGCGGSCDQGCASGYWCDAGSCEVCTADTACGPQCLDCTADSVQGSHCVANAGGAYCACYDDSECLGAYYCMGGAPSGVCTACDTAAHCGASCVNCAANASNTACVNGSCGCASVSDCATGESCVGGACEVVQPEICDNLDDDDGDGMVDCADVQDCPEHTSCRPMRRCEGGHCLLCSQQCSSNADCEGCVGAEVCNVHDHCCASCSNCYCIVR